MALEVIDLTREFTFKKNGTLITLADPDPSMSAEDVLQHYGSQYPELTTATLDVPKVEGGKSIYNVRTTVGTKG